MAERIMIIGGPGSGKSTLARAIGDDLSLPVTHLDSLYWTPGWVPQEPAVFAQAVDQAIAQPKWVIDGNYRASIAERAQRADLIVFLDAPTPLRIRRIVSRTKASRGQSRPDLAPECPERFTAEFFWYAAKWGVMKRAKILRRCKNAGAETKVMRLTPAPLAELVSAVRAGLPTDA